MKKILVLFGIVLVAIVFFVVYKFDFSNKDLVVDQDKKENFYDGEYNISGQKVILKKGLSEVQSIPGGASKTITRYFGNTAEGDIDGDRVSDIAYLITQETGGSGTFYYATARLNKESGVVFVDPTFIGDRIAPQTTEIKNGQVVVNYADRKPEESFTTPPSVGKSLYLKLDPKSMQFGEVIQDFEGEADPSRMNLSMKTWNWVKTSYTSGIEVKPKTNKFSLTFKDDTFSATTDCNFLSGQYVLNGEMMISFQKMMSTKMYCSSGSQESEFNSMLTDTESYVFTSKGELIFILKQNKGQFIFR